MKFIIQMASALNLSCATTVHQVTEKELPQYVEYVISKFGRRSYKVSARVY